MLRSVLNVLDEMSAKIRYTAVPLNELITEISGESAYSDCTFLKRTAADIGSRLGGTDTEGQLSMLALGSTLISRGLESAELEYSRKSRTLMSVWTLCGIGAGIIII